jgi:hypothetical protein
MKERLRMRGFLLPESELDGLDGLDDDGANDGDDDDEGDAPFDTTPGEA